MRNWIGLLLVSLLAATGCETIEERDVPGRIPQREAVRIATQACKQFPRIYGEIPRVRWEDRDGGYWVVDITEPSGTYGKFYMINGRGKIVGVGKLPLRHGEPRRYVEEYQYQDGPIYNGPVIY